MSVLYNSAIVADNDAFMQQEIAMLEYIPVVGAVTALGAFWFTRQSWGRTNRPFLNLRLEPYDDERTDELYLVVKNVGNRAARNVQFTMFDDDLKCVAWNAADCANLPWLLARLMAPNVIFSLAPGEEVRTYIGHISPDGKYHGKDYAGPVPLWMPMKNLPIVVAYRDFAIEAAAYHDFFELRNHSLKDFAGISLTIKRETTVMDFRFDSDRTPPSDKETGTVFRRCTRKRSKT